ncbi:hypothetical protein ACLOJK_032962 [Asimina triloba]
MCRIVKAFGIQHPGRNKIFVQSRHVTYSDKLQGSLVCHAKSDGTNANNFVKNLSLDPHTWLKLLKSKTQFDVSSFDASMIATSAM